MKRVKNRIVERIKQLLLIAEKVGKVDEDLGRLYYWRAFSLGKRNRVKVNSKVFCRKCFRKYSLKEEKGKKFLTCICGYRRRLREDV